MSEQVTYELAAVRWRRSQTVDIVTRLGNQIAVFPLSFLLSCGDNTWEYVLYVVNLPVDQIRGHDGRIVIGDDPQAIDDALPVDLQGSPTAGTYYYIQDG
jgi:phenolic acid decarboxylase